MQWLIVVGLVVLAYLIGSVSFGVLASRLFGLADPRSFGSKNPGATNVLRSGSKGAAAFTLVGDAAKGWVGTSLPLWIGGLAGDALAASVFLAPIAVVVGHMFPIFHGFKGGKGVAPAGGALLGIHWVLGLATIATWLVLLFFFRISSFAALASSLFSVVYGLMFFKLGSAMLAVGAISVLVVWRHHENIGRLLAGKEPRIGAKPGVKKK
jgi:acyl phosphate:glycerol-3-phosphate acyltransferase